MAVKELKRIACKFDIHGEVIKVEQNLCGHINKTIIVHVSSVETAQEPRQYILQRINHHVFQDPIAVMRNIQNVTQHIEWKLRNEYIRHGQKTLKLIPMKECHDQYYFQNDEHDGSIWRCYNFVQGCKTYNTVENAKQAYQAAYAFGMFQYLVSDIPIETILETIPDFHNTPKRLERLLEVVKLDCIGRLKSVENEINFVRRRKHFMTKLINLCKNGKIPIRITHNDTKINNVMMDIVTDEAVCVIDLDTVMP